MIFTSLLDFTGPFAVAKLSDLLRAWLSTQAAPARSLSSLARSCNLSTQTVGRILSRETREPRMTTILLILHGLGFRAVRFER
jgi:DNA-binding phage protein